MLRNSIDPKEKTVAESDVHVEKDRHIKVAIHGAFYRWAKNFVKGKNVLDAGCGEGHGTAILAETANQVVGIDIKARIIEKASRCYPLNNVEFRVENCQKMSFQPGSFDIVLCNALFEYLTDVRAFMENAFQLLKPNGLFICGTKNLELSLQKQDGSPLYRNHLQEFTPAELTAELERYYTGVKIYGERMKTRSEAYILNDRALKIEGSLVALNIKHYFPKSWRNFVRKLITGVDVNDITADDFEIVEHSLHDAFYIIGWGAKA